MSDAIVVSVVIPHRDQPGLLAEQLGALADQVYSEPWEVIVADNGSRRGPGAVIESMRPRLPGLRLVDAASESGPAHARNAGALAAYGRLLLFCDADDRVAPGWVEAMASALVEADLVASRYDVESLNEKSIAEAFPHPQAVGLNPYDDPPFLPHAGGGGLGVRRELHEELGGFDESLTALEDTDYCWRAQLAGRRFAFAGDAVVSIRLRSSPGQAFRQAFSYGRHNVEIYSRYRDRGMPRASAVRGLLKWAPLLLAVPRLLSGRTRLRWLWQLGWRCGRLDGCRRYSVWAP